MNSKILNEIYHGQLKPWLISFDESVLKETIREVSKIQTNTLQGNENRLKRLLQPFPDLLKNVKPFGEVGIISQQYLKLLHQLGFCGGFFTAYLFYFLVDGFCAFGIKSPGHKFFEQNAIQYFYFHYKPIFILLAATVFFSSITLA